MAAVALLAPSPASAQAPPAYCTGQRITDDFGVLYYPNGQRVIDGFGKEHYPNGLRVTNDFGDEIRWANGARTRNRSGDLLYPNGTPVSSAFGDVRYPNGQRVRDGSGNCFFATGVPMKPCQRAVDIRDGLLGGATAFYRLDLEAGVIDLRSVRYEFPAASLPVAAGLAADFVVTLSTDLEAGRLDRGSIAAVCPAGAPRR